MHYALDEQMGNDLTWKKVLYNYSEELLKFVVNGTTNTLNTPDNLRRWNIASNVVCGLCGNPGATLKHVLAGCPWVRDYESKTKSEDRYTWRHNCVLLVLARAMIAKVAISNQRPTSKNEVKSSQLQPFVKAGQRLKNAKRPTQSTLDKARDWVYDFDLPEFHHNKKNALVFPCDVLITKKRIDGYILSREEKICILGPEVTAPMDDNVLKWHAEKTSKYRSNIAEAEADGWSFHDCSLEVGALGWIPPSNWKILRSLGFTNAETKSISEDMTLIARRCSYVIFLNRFNKEFQPFRISPRSAKAAPEGEFFDSKRAEPEPSVSLDELGLPVLTKSAWLPEVSPCCGSLDVHSLEDRYYRLCREEATPDDLRELEALMSM